MPDQLTMFEPTGPDLSALLFKHLASSRSCARVAELLDERGFSFGARAYRAAAARAEADALVLEIALQLEAEAGLV
ncbi:MAG: hypothetical protein P4L96_03855 [Rhodoferax sp.]|nr:hypothetical protein [Rhodoferax sp.]